MCWKKKVELLKLCNTPASIISPIPLFAISLFLISRKDFSIFDLPILSVGIMVSILSNFASNLWNHCNDIKEDKAQGKITILTKDSSMQKLALLIVIFLYLCLLLFVYYLSIELKRPIFLYFLIWALATWWYSDNLILKKIFGFRLKEHYIGELVTYGIAWPMYTFSIWQIYSDSNVTGVLISAAFFFISISGLLLKDLKDISGDRKAGLQTFGVIFTPSRLIKYSCYFMIVFYLVILNPLTVRLFSTGILVIVIPFVYFLKYTFIHLYKKNWLLELGDFKAVRGIGSSIYASIILLGLSVFI